MPDDQTENGPEPDCASIGDDISTSAEVRSSEQPTTSARPRLQQRFEDSHAGRRIISAVILVILGTQVVWSMPLSPIRECLMPIVEPVNVINVNERWSMFAPEPPKRVEKFKGVVTMADGSTRTWRLEPGSLSEKLFLPDRWFVLMEETTIRQQDGRKELARWIVGEVAGPSERPVKVALSFDYKILPKPGEPSKESTGNRVIYEEVLTGQQ